MKFIDTWKKKVSRFKLEVRVLFLAYKDPRVPWFAKFFTACVVGYALSPIDLIPDFIPILGYLDDLVLIPLGVFFALKMFPKELLEEYRIKVQETMPQKKPVNWITGIIIISIWVIVATTVVYLLLKHFLK